MSDDASACRLYLAGSPALYGEPDGVARLAAGLEDAAAAGIDIGCLRLPAPPASYEPETLRALVEAGQRQGIATLIEDRLDLVLRVGADGLHLGDGTHSVEAARRALGPSLSLGVACGLSRHAAMEAAEAGADYVSFTGDAEELLDLVGWWAEVMTPPLVAEGVATPEEAARLAAAGADFLCPALAFPSPSAGAVLRVFAAALRGAALGVGA